MVGGLGSTDQRPIFYCNAVGGNDQLIFDGTSIAVNSSGELIAQLPSFREHEAIIDTNEADAMKFRESDTPEELFGALSLGLRDYLRKCNFKSAVLGLSGGIDSAVVAGLACGACRAQKVNWGIQPKQFYSRGRRTEAVGPRRDLG